MYLIHEELARARIQGQRAEAERRALTRRLVTVQRWQRRVDTASRRVREARAALA